MSAKRWWIRVGDPSPQTDPDSFTTEEIMLEVRHLMAQNRRYGAHPLRTAAYTRLLAVVKERESRA